MSDTTIPLFPLRTVLFPAGHLPLRIFEQRYIDMVRECSRDDSGFGVCLAADDDEATPPYAQIGTVATIRDWYTFEDGLLGIAAVGGARFMIQGATARDNGLLDGEVIWLPEPEPVRIPEEMALLSTIASRFMEKLDDHYPDFRPELLEDASWVGYRLAEWLPLKLRERQTLLELSDPEERLQQLMEILPRFQSDG